MQNTLRTTILDVTMNRTSSWLRDGLVLKEGLTGKGLFTNIPIPKGDLVVMSGGTVMTSEEEARLPEEMRDYAIQIDRDLFIGPRTLEEVSDSDFINHSCDPNCGVKGQIALVSMRDIDAGEEITFDYAMVLTGSHECYPLECLCGSDACRKIVTQNDWMIGDLQHRYDGYFSEYIIKLIKMDILSRDQKA